MGSLRSAATPGGKAPALDFGGYSNDSPFPRVWGLLERILERVEAQEQTVLIAQTYKLLCSESLRWPPYAQGGRVSVITGFGIPFEFSFTTADTLGTVRFLSEAAPASEPLHRRVVRTLECLAELAGLHRLSCSRATIEELAAGLLPSTLEDFDASWPNGALWVSARFARSQPPVLRVYVNQQWNNNAFRFINSQRLLWHLGQDRNAERLLQLFDAVEGWAQVAGVSFDISVRSIGGVKLYLGATGATLERIAALLRRLGLERFQDLAWSFFRKMNLVRNRFAGPSLLVSIGFQSEADRPLSLKADVTTRAVFDCDRDAYMATEDVLRTFRMHCMGYRACEDLFFPHGFPCGTVRTLQYVGLALPGVGPPRLNVYLAPPVNA